MSTGRVSTGRRWLVVASIGVVLAAACGGGGSEASDDAPADQEEAGPPYDVGRVDLELLDVSRATQADALGNLAEQAGRTIPTVVLYPDADGAFPLIVFAHGHTRAGTEYVELVSEWVTQGYVVALPSFPLSSGPEAISPVSYTDVVNQPGDISFVVRELTERSNDEPGSEEDNPLAHRIDTEHVGVVGHSLGAITALGLRNNTCCTDPNVDAVVAVAGMTLPFPGDPIDRDGTPLLLIHSKADPTVPAAGSENVFAEALPPLSFLEFAEGGHDEILDGGGAQAALTQHAILAFFDDQLRGAATTWQDLPAKVEESGLATFQSTASRD